MRYLWVDTKQDVDWVKGPAHQITGYFFPVNDPAAEVRRRIADVLNHKTRPGLYMAWNWSEFSGLNGVGVANKMHTLVTERTVGVAPKVQFDIEAHDPQLILDCLRRWRQLRPTQDTSWTMESHQGGWMSPEFVAEIVRLRVRVVPQAYIGDMKRVAEDFVLRDLLKRGFPEGLVSLFYDAAQLPAGGGWDGYAFTQQRLP